MAPIYSNRAQCYIKLEAYGAAQNDADKALENNPKFFKAYYRKGSAYLALGKLKLALDNLKQVIYPERVINSYDQVKKIRKKMGKKDKDLIRKIKMISKLYKQQQFELAMSYDAEPDPIKYSDITVPESYGGLKLEKMEDLTAEWLSFTIYITLSQGC